MEAKTFSLFERVAVPVLILTLSYLDVKTRQDFARVNRYFLRIISAVPIFNFITIKDEYLSKIKLKFLSLDVTGTNFNFLNNFLSLERLKINNVSEVYFQTPPIQNC